MSRRRRSQTSSPSLQHGLPTDSVAVSTAQPEARPAIVIRYAQSDQDVVAIHQFLCVVAGPTLPGDIDAQKSAIEVWRVVNHDVALMAVRGNLLVGTFGLMCVTAWWGKTQYLANRWAFCLPGSRALKPLLREAKAIAVASEMELHLISENRGKVIILNKSERRNVFRESGREDANNSTGVVA